MLAIAAAILFGLALLLYLIGESIAGFITVDSLTIAGLLCVALHMAGVGTRFPSRRR